MKKVLFFCVLLLLVGFGLYITILKSKNKTPTAQPSVVAPSTSIPNWNTYTNHSLGFSIQYPNAVSVINLANENDGIEFILSEENNPNYTVHNRSVDLQILRRGNSHDSVAKAVAGETCGGCVTTTKPIVINNAVGVVTTSGFSFPENYYVTDQNAVGSPVRISLSYRIGSTDQRVELFRKMIQTFKFLR